MGWDFAILVGVTICQGLTGYWAFHMSTNHGRARWGFAAVTVIGIGLVIWTGMRTSQTSNQLASGVTHIEQMGGAAAEMLQMLSNIQASQNQILTGYQQQMITQDEQLKEIAAETKSFANRPAPLLGVLSSPQSARPVSQPAPPLSASSSAWLASLNETLAKSRQDAKEHDEKFQAYIGCLNVKNPIVASLTKLLNAVPDFENGWAYSRDVGVLEKNYISWVGGVRQFLAEHKNILPNPERFEQVKEYEMGPTLLVIPSSGNGAFANFHLRWDALNAIMDDYNKTACKAEDDALSTKPVAPSPQSPQGTVGNTPP